MTTGEEIEMHYYFFVVSNRESPLHKKPIAVLRMGRVEDKFITQKWDPKRGEWTDCSYVHSTPAIDGEYPFVLTTEEEGFQFIKKQAVK